jgi:nitroreductase
MLMDVIEAIRTRRTTKLYRSEPPSRDLIEQVLESAVWAPNHRLTEPWQFFVLSGDSLQRAAALRAQATEQTVVAASEEIRRSKGEEARRKALAAPVCIVVAAEQAADPTLGEEDYAATAAAIQNMLLSARGLGLAAFWGTGILVGYEPFREFLGLSPTQRIVGLVQLGYGAQERSQKRAPAASKTHWMA